MITVHERTGIRNYVIGVLKASKPDGQGGTIWATNAEERVYPDRTEPLRSSDLPWPRISVYTPKETVDEKNSSVWDSPENPGILKRELLLDVAIIDLADREGAALDATALQVEFAIDADCTFGERIDSEMLIDTSVEFADQGDQDFAVMRLRYLIVYRTLSRTADVVPDPIPSEVFASVSPEIGIPYFDEYVEITHTGVPPVGPPKP